MAVWELFGLRINSLMKIIWKIIWSHHLTKLLISQREFTRSEASPQFVKQLSPTCIIHSKVNPFLTWGRSLFLLYGLFVPPKLLNSPSQVTTEWTRIVKSTIRSLSLSPTHRFNRIFMKPKSSIFQKGLASLSNGFWVPGVQKPKPEAAHKYCRASCSRATR